ncbi:hypothetical protein NQZ79_g6002 [Umbelopsis isabellina]|nr:hypothetical protein NQZ79_g6002 [Umbelopsis isabellina]
MPALVGAAWAAYGIAVGVLVVFCIGFTRHYQDKHESELFATIVTIVGLSLLLATLALLPVDIFLVSSTVDYTTGLKKHWANPDTVYWMTLTIEIVYYVCYSLIGVFTFFVIPFTYFYYEESDDDTTSGQRTAAAMKYTSFFVAISVILLLLGLFIRTSNIHHPRYDLDWFKHILTQSSKLTSGMMNRCGENGSICVGLPYLGWHARFHQLYGNAPGLSILPFNLIKGRRRLETEEMDVDARLSECREQQRAIKLKASPESMSAKDLRRLENLEDEERILLRRRRGIEEEEQSFWQKLAKIARPFEVVYHWICPFGTNTCHCGIDVLDHWSSLAHHHVPVFSSTTKPKLNTCVFLDSIDKVANSVCGSKCGYIISHPEIFNPINYIFVKLSNYFPLDYVFMIALILYFFMATMAGIITMGVRFLWVQLYRIQKRATAPQGLMCCTILLTLSLLALNYTLTAVVAPGYSHFGSQVYCNSTMDHVRNCTGKPNLIVPCDIYAPTGFVAALFKRPRNNVDDETDEHLDADEEQALLDDARRRQRYGGADQFRDNQSPNPVLASTAEPNSS